MSMDVYVICWYYIAFAWVCINYSTFSVTYGVQHLTAKQSKIQEYLNAQRNITDELLNGYDKRFIPAIPEEPLEVKLGVKISDVLRLDDQEMECELIVYIRQKWTDYRLSWNHSHRRNNQSETNPVPIKKIKVREHFLDKIWLPDIRISNLKDMNQFEKFGGINMNIHTNGRVYYSQLVLVKIHCPMNLHNFPMDQQTCFLNFSSYAYAKSLLTFVLRDKKVGRVNLPHFDFVEAKEIVDEVQERLKVKRISIALIFKRRLGYYILQIYIPSLFLVILSWLAFLLKPTDIANRLALATTTIVSIVFLHTEMNTSLPPVSYAKASDWFVLVSFAFILFALLESSLVYRMSTMEAQTRPLRPENVQDVVSNSLLLERRERKLPTAENRGEKSDGFETKLPSEKRSSSSTFIDKVALFLFPLMYCGFNIFYWFHYM